VLRFLSNQPYLLVFLATLFWAGNAIAGKIAVGHISPFVLTSLRWLVALMLVTPFAVRYIKDDWKVIRGKLIFLFALGAVGFTVFNNMMYLALTTTTAINVAIIQSALPLFIFILNLAFFQISVSKFQAIGFPISLIGVATITFQGSFSLLVELQLNVGDVLMIGAVCAYGIYSVFLKNKPNIHWLSTLTVLSCAALIASIPFSVYEIVTGLAKVPDLIGFSVVLYTAVFASLLAQAFWIRSVEIIGSNSTSLFINVVPVFGVLFAVVFLREELQVFHAIGISLIIGGVYIGQLGSQSKALE
jgi:drug/metabolite transporter (DMT)-like permease